MIDLVPFGTAFSENAGDEPPHHLKLIPNAEALVELPIKTAKVTEVARNFIRILQAANMKHTIAS
jgi:hypothetical protein